MLKIDVFSHILPPRYLKERNARAAFGGSQYARYYRANPALTDLGFQNEAFFDHRTNAHLVGLPGTVALDDEGGVVIGLAWIVGH